MVIDGPTLVAQMEKTWCAIEEAGAGRPKTLWIHPSQLAHEELMAELRAAAVMNGFSIAVQEPI